MWNSLCRDTWQWEAVDAQIERETTELKSPPPRAYHSLTLVPDGTLLMFGGFNGKVTFGDLWTLSLHPAAASATEAGTSSVVTPDEKAVAGPDHPESEGQRTANLGTYHAYRALVRLGVGFV